MEVSALKYSGGLGLHGRTPLLRLQSDDRLIAFIRKGNQAAFEVLAARYETRLLAFCRHLLGSREDAEDVLQEVLTAAFNAILADERAINVRPWLYRIARNRSLNHLRRIQAIGVDSMDLHYSDHGASTADKVHDREEFRLLVGDIHELPETQKTALVLREMDALSYEQIAEAMETTVPSVKSLLVRARVSLAEAAEARLLSCEEVRIELGEVSEGLRRRPSPLVRRHLRACKRCTVFRTQLRHTNKALAALMPIGPLVILKKLALVHLGHSAGAGSGATAAGSGATGAAGAGAGTAGAGAAGAGAAGASAGGSALAGSGFAVSSGGFLSAGLGAIATKAAAGLAAAAIVTAGAVEAGRSSHHSHRTAIASVHEGSPAQQASATSGYAGAHPRSIATTNRGARPASSGPANTGTKKRRASAAKPRPVKTVAATRTTASAVSKPVAPVASQPKATIGAPVPAKATPPGRDQTQTDPTVLPPSANPTGGQPSSGGSPPQAGAPPTSPPPSTPPGSSPPPSNPPPSSPPPSSPPPSSPPPSNPPATSPPPPSPPTSSPPTTSPIFPPGFGPAYDAGT